MKYKVLMLACALFGVTAQAQNVEKVEIGDNQNFGITYSLPQTDVCATLNMVCYQITAGPYAQYAEKYLGLKDVAMDDQTKWELVSLTIEDVPVPDQERTFHINFPEKGALPTFYLTEDGFLLSINREPDVNEVAAVEKKTEQEPKLVLKASDVMSEDILRAGSKAKQAELAAKEIFSLRESKRDILRGEIENMPKDGASLQIMLDNLDAQEKALLSLFVGVTTEKQVSKNVHFVPSKSVDNKVYFRFSEHEGLVDNDDMIGEPYYISIRITEDNRMEQPEVDPKKKPALGIAYNVPGKAHVTLSFDGEIVAETDMFMGQFGHVEQLPVAQFTDKKKVVSATFNQVTGSIKTYEQ